MLKDKPVDWLGKEMQQMQKQKKQERSKAKNESNQKTGTKPSHDLADYTGLYNHPGYGLWKFIREKIHLFPMPLKRYYG